MKFSKTYKLRSVKSTRELHIKIPTEFVDNYIGEKYKDIKLYEYLSVDGVLLITAELNDIVMINDKRFVYTGEVVGLRLRGNTYFIRVPFMFKSMNIMSGNNLDSISIDMGDDEAILIYTPENIVE